MDGENHYPFDVLHKKSDHHQLLLFEKDVFWLIKNMYQIILAIENSFVEYAHNLPLGSKISIRNK